MRTIKLKDNNYWDTSSIMHNRTNLSTYLNNKVEYDVIDIDNATTLGESSKVLDNKYNKIDIICAINTANVTSRIVIPIYNGYQVELPCIVYINGLFFLANRSFELNNKTLSWSNCTCYGINGNASTLSNQNTCVKPLKAICYYK